MNAVKLVVFPTSDIAKSKGFFSELLGTEPYADSPYYTGFRTGEMEIGLTPAMPQQSTTAPIVYVDVADINSALAGIIAKGGEKVQDPTDVANGLLIAIVKNCDGSAIGLRQQPKA
ncbi:MAG: VOC family protein [Candidatus Tumulicola sp.]